MAKHELPREDQEKREAAQRGERPIERRVAPPAPELRAPREPERPDRRQHEDEPVGPGIHSRGDQMRPKDMEHHLDRLWPGRDDA